MVTPIVEMTTGWPTSRLRRTHRHTGGYGWARNLPSRPFNRRAPYQKAARLNQAVLRSKLIDRTRILWICVQKNSTSNLWGYSRFARIHYRPPSPVMSYPIIRWPTGSIRWLSTMDPRVWRIFTHRGLRMSKNCPRRAERSLKISPMLWTTLAKVRPSLTMMMCPCFLQARPREVLSTHPPVHHRSGVDWGKEWGRDFSYSV